MTKKIRVAVVGCGRVSRTAHYETLKNNPAYEFVAVCDTDKQRADEWSAKNKVKAYYSLKDMLESEKLDLVSINTPNGYHAKLGKMVAERGIHVITEKPLAMNLDDAD